ncbi:hypothetical protein MalM25_03060 [Planctomycetes bacterium MalM25]|nr:hypothetical protein MalM25_03060 [Planctomycetes bacterium MalM25]
MRSLQLILALGLLAPAWPLCADDLSGFTGLRMNQIQVIGTHNSYKQPIEPELFRMARPVSPDMDHLDYAHLPLSEQLNLGLRSLEIDIYNDPKGGRYAAPIGLELLRQLGLQPAEYDPSGEMNRPGFKVLHVADLDFRSHCLTFKAALAELKAWSERNAEHLPIVITMNLKDSRAKFPNAVEPAPFDAASFDALDEAIRQGLGDDRLITPDLVRGASPTLESAVLNQGWPRLDDVRGRFLWVMDERGEKAAAYREGHPSLAERVLFTIEEPGSSESAVLIMNDPIAQGEAIRRLVRQGYLVRTRADSSTKEARSGDTARRRAAIESGAQIVSTDYPQPDPRWETGYCVRYPDGTYIRPNPVTSEATR